MYSAVFNSSSILYFRFCLSVVFALSSPNAYFKKNSKGEIVSVFFSQPHDGMLPGKFLLKDFHNTSKFVDFFFSLLAMFGLIILESKTGVCPTNWPIVYNHKLQK